MTLNTLERSPKRSANQWTAPGLDCIESFRRFFEYEIDAANPIEMWFVTAPIKKSAQRVEAATAAHGRRFCGQCAGGASAGRS